MNSLSLPGGVRSRFFFAVLAWTGLALATVDLSAADPRTNSWFTKYSTRYARIYTTDINKTNGTSATSWTGQTTAAYAGVQEVYSSASWVYVRSTGLGSHVMGPWYLDAAHTQAFPNMPVNTKTLYRIPRTPSVPVSKTLTGGGNVGYFVDGVAMFNSWDSYYWNGSAEVGGGGGSGYWNRDAYVNEGLSFDPANAHQPQDGTYHYHANPPGLRYLLGDHVNLNATTKAYTESTNAATQHSPILGWVNDGYPLYGPYGYSNATNPASGIRRMISGFVLRNGANGTDNLTSAGRSTIPAWAGRSYNLTNLSQAGPAVSTQYPLGRYMEDNAHLGDLGKTQGVDFDLDEYNGRYCVTPEFPNGTYAYFVSINSNGAPAFPYNLSRSFYGTPTGGSVTSIAEAVTTNILAGTNTSAVVSTPTVTGNTVTLVWSGLEGGTYRVETSTNLSTGWSQKITNIVAAGNTLQTNFTRSSSNEFYRVARTALATFDPVSGTAGGGGTSVAAPGGTVTRGTTVTVLITLPTNPPQPPVDRVPTSVTLAGTINGTSITRPSLETVQVTFTVPANASTGLQNIVITFNPAPTYTMTGALTVN